MPTLEAKKVDLVTKDGAVHDSIQVDGNPDVIVWGAFERTKVFVRSKAGRYVEASVFVSKMPYLKSIQGW